MKKKTAKTLRAKPGVREARVTVPVSGGDRASAGRVRLQQLGTLRAETEQARGRMTMQDVLDLQRTVGNRATGALLTRARPPQRSGSIGSPETSVTLQAPAPGSTLVNSVRISRTSGTTLQRHPEGAELPAKEDLVGELDPNAPPAATRTAKQAKKDKAAAAKAGKEEKAAQKVSPKATSLAATQKILTGAFGGFKTIISGTIVILVDQPACSAKYDEVCIADGVKRPDGSDWKAGDCAKDDAAAGVQTEGFAWKGTIYVNGATTLITATAHEMLHVNTGGDYRAKMGETFNEGTTEFLARKAIKAAGLTVPAVTAYPDQVGLTAKLIALVGEDTVTSAYFSGPQPLIDAYTSKGNNTWEKLREHAEALNLVEAKKDLKRKRRRKRK